MEIWWLATWVWRCVCLVQAPPELDFAQGLPHFPRPWTWRYISKSAAWNFRRQIRFFPSHLRQGGQVGCRTVYWLSTKRWTWWWLNNGRKHSPTERVPLPKSKIGNQTIRTQGKSIQTISTIDSVLNSQHFDNPNKTLMTSTCCFQYQRAHVLESFHPYWHQLLWRPPPLGPLECPGVRTNSPFLSQRGRHPQMHRTSRKVLAIGVCPTSRRRGWQCLLLCHNAHESISIQHQWHLHWYTGPPKNVESRKKTLHSAAHSLQITNMFQNPFCHNIRRYWLDAHRQHSWSQWLRTHLWLNLIRFLSHIFYFYWFLRFNFLCPSQCRTQIFTPSDGHVVVNKTRSENKLCFAAAPIWPNNFDHHLVMPVPDASEQNARGDGDISHKLPHPGQKHVHSARIWLVNERGQIRNKKQNPRYPGNTFVNVPTTTSENCRIISARQKGAFLSICACCIYWDDWILNISCGKKREDHNKKRSPTTM